MIRDNLSQREPHLAGSARAKLYGFNTSRSRRWLITALGGGQRFSSRAKLLFSILIFLISFSIKSLVAVDLSPVMYTIRQPAGGMALEYHQEAVSITDGHGLLVPANWDSSDTTLLRHAPGYSIYLATIYSLFGKSYFTVQLIQNAINSLSAVLIFLIAGHLLTWPVGVAAGLLAALSHHLCYYSNFILPDSICALPLLIAVYLLVRANRGRSREWWTYAIAGMMIGLSTGLRPNTMMMGPFLALLLIALSRRRAQTAKRAWIIAIAPFIMIAPITIRNYIIFGEFVPISANTGIVLWEGIADGGGERFGAVDDDKKVADQEAAMYGDPRYAESWATPDGIKRDRDRIKRSLNVIINHPFWFSGVMIRRMGEMFKYSAQAPLVFKSTDTRLIEAGETIRQSKRNGGDEDASDEDASREANPSKRKLSRLRALAYGESISWARTVVRASQRVVKESLLAFILIGALILFFLSRRRWMYIMLVPLYYLLIQSTMHTEFRYTLPMHYFVFIFAAVTWVLIGRAAWAGINRFVGLRNRNRTEQPAAST
jgi:hypothetical protein